MKEEERPLFSRLSAPLPPSFSQCFVKRAGILFCGEEKKKKEGKKVSVGQSATAIVVPHWSKFHTTLTDFLSREIFPLSFFFSFPFLVLPRLLHRLMFQERCVQSTEEASSSIPSHLSHVARFLRQLCSCKTQKGEKKKRKEEQHRGFAGSAGSPSPFFVFFFFLF